MAFKEILVQLDNHRNYEARLQLALSIAQRSDAHLVALYGLELPQIPSMSPGFAEVLYVGNAAAQATYERERDAAFSDAEQLEARFHALIKRAGVQGSWESCPEKPKDFINLVTKRARYTDLAIVGQNDPDHPGAAANLPETVMLGCGRPVLIVPHDARAHIACANVLVAWNGTREAARAVGDAMPILRSATAVTLLTVGGIEEADEDDARPGRTLLEHLRQHGIRAEATHLTSGGLDTSELILSRAADIGGDLIVMGGYGHSRTRELVLGGVTRSILKHMTVPVLMSH
ncbi:MAG TPA: universal stress protein [Stellaceae bacterium]|nr:universal stress protein [Stellaceae bacterium]